MINTEKFNKVIETAKAKTADKKWLGAIERAAEGILSGALIVTTIDDAHSLVTSPNGSYWTNGKCSCRAAQAGHRECYHRAAAQLWKRYEEALYTTVPAAVSRDEYPATFKSDVAAAPREHLILEITNIWPRFSTTPLAIALESRFGCNNLNALDIDLLRRVRLAIAA